MASSRNGRVARTLRKARRNTSTASGDENNGRRRWVTTVKKYDPPWTKARRYRMENLLVFVGLRCAQRDPPARRVLWPSPTYPFLKIAPRRTLPPWRVVLPGWDALSPRGTLPLSDYGCLRRITLR